MARNKDESSSSSPSLDFALVARLLALIVLFGIALQWTGFFLATTIFLMGGYWVLGERRPKILILASLPFAGGIWFVLTQLLNIYLAPGQLMIMITEADMLDGLFTGLSTAIMPFNLMMVVVGCFAGTFIGMLPGLGPISAVALMIPITYGLDPSSASS